MKLSTQTKLRAVTLSIWLLLGGLSHAQGPPSSYYSSVDTSSPSTLRASLHAVIDDHQRYPYTSSGTDTWDILEAAQEDPSNSNLILDIYRNEDYPKQGGGNSFYNREHSWPNSYGFPDDGGSNYPYTDCHVLFLCDIRLERWVQHRSVLVHHAKRHKRLPKVVQKLVLESARKATNVWVLRASVAERTISAHHRGRMIARTATRMECRSPRARRCQGRCSDSSARCNKRRRVPRLAPGAAPC